MPEPARRKPSRAALLLPALLLLSSCVSQGSRWEIAAAAAALADIGTTGGALANGATEANPVYGKSPSPAQVFTLNAGAYGATWALIRHLDPVNRQRVWRAVTVVRLLATAWNLNQGCVCFKVTW